MSHRRCCCNYGCYPGFGSYGLNGTSGSWGTGFSGNNWWWVVLLLVLANRNNN